MKLFALAMALAALITVTRAETPPKPDPKPTHLDFTNSGRGSVGLDVKETGDSRAVGHNWETDYGSYDRDFARTRTVGVTVSNVGHGAVSTAKVEVIWFARRLEANDVFIFSRQTKDADVPAGRGKELPFTMPTMKSNVTNFAAMGERWATGSKYIGYLVILRAGEKVLAAKGSAPSLDQLTHTPEKLEPLLVKASKLKDDSSS